MQDQTAAAPQLSVRIRSVDLLRGLVIILMALDHVRDFWGPTPGLPEDLESPSLELFLTRWITHFCAPVFVFLSGTSAWLYARNTNADTFALSRFLATRGIWLIIVELTIINFSWTLYSAGFVFVQVLWAIGWSMIFLALLVHLPVRAIAAIGLLLIFGHNLFDGIDPETLGAFGPFWAFLHVSYGWPIDGWFYFWIAYPVVPWIGVMAVGYAFGAALTSGMDWRRFAFRTGLAATVLFLVLRLLQAYGDPNAWQLQDSVAQTIIGFLNTEKYPPSLQFLLMTLGPALMLMPLLEDWRARLAEWISVFGRVPFFFYVIHMPVIHLGAIVWSQFMFGRSGWNFGAPDQYPPEYQQNLWLVWGVWVAVVLLLYPACKWYAALKRRRKDWWLSYL